MEYEGYFLFGCATSWYVSLDKFGSSQLFAGTFQECVDYINRVKGSK